MTNQETNHPLGSITIESPCSESWQEMTGDEQKRFCEKCSLHVHNLREMKQQDVHDLISRSHEGICIRMHQRPDGSIMTKEETLPWNKRIPRLIKTLAAGILAGMGFLSSCSAESERELQGKPEIDIHNRIGTKDPRIGGERIGQIKGRMVMTGKMVVPPTPPEKNDKK